MRTDFNSIKRCLIMAVLLLGSLRAFAQPYQIQISISVLPPYSTKVSDYTSTPGKVVATLTNITASNTAADIYLMGSIVGMSGIRIATEPGYKPSQPITIMPNASILLTVDKLGDVFNTSHLVYEGISQRDIIFGGLPEDDYQICLKAYDYKTDNVVSDDEVCSAVFSVANLEPPMILSAFCSDTVEAQTPQQLILNWSLPVNAPLNTQYRIRMADVIPVDRNPYDALNTTGSPLFFDQTVQTTTFLYGAAQPTLIEGHRYAFTVTAVDPSGAAVFKNGGQSEICTFIWAKKGIDTINLEMNKPSEGSVLMAEKLKIFVPYCGISEHSTENPAVGDELGKVISVNNATPFYLRWEDRTDLLTRYMAEHLLLDTGNTPSVAFTEEGIVYLVQVYDFTSNNIVYEEQVWNNPYCQKEYQGLPFENDKKYNLSVKAYYAKRKGTPLTGKGGRMKYGYNILTPLDETTLLASSDICDFRYIRMQDYQEPNSIMYYMTGKLLYRFQDYPETYPISSTQIKLTKYLMIKDSLTGEVKLEHCPVQMAPAFCAVAGSIVYATTNEDGTFEANFWSKPNGGDYGVKELTFNGKAYRGRLLEYYELQIVSPYFRDPSTRIELHSDSLNLNEIVAQVYDYTLKVNVSKGYYRYNNGKREKTGSLQTTNPRSIKAKIWRLECPANVPYYEGDVELGATKATAIKHVAEGLVSTETVDGKQQTVVTFNKLICNMLNGSPKDVYKIDIEQDTVIDGVPKRYISDLWLQDIRFKPENAVLLEAYMNNKTHFNHSINATIVSLDPPKSKLRGKLVYKDPTDPQSMIAPVRKSKVSLIATYLIEDSKGYQTIVDPHHLYQEVYKGASGQNDAVSGGATGKFEGSYFEEKIRNEFPDANTVLATTTTDMEGNFTFDFANIDSLGSRAYQNSFSEGKEFHVTANLKGTLVRTVRLVVSGSNAAKFINPSDNIFIHPNDSLNAGTLTAYLNAYSLQIYPLSDTGGVLKAPRSVVTGAKIKIAKYWGIDSTTLSGMTDSAFVESIENGCTFHSIPLHSKNKNYDDVKITISTSDTVGENSYETRIVRFPRAYSDSVAAAAPISQIEQSGDIILLWKYDSLFYKPATTFGNNYYSFIKEDYKPITVKIDLYLKPKQPIISGRVLDASNTMRSVESGQVKLFSSQFMGIATPTVRPVSEANGNGYFTFTNLKTNEAGFSYYLQVAAPGYKLYLAKEKNKDGDTVNVPASNDGRIPAGSDKIRLQKGQQVHFAQILMMPNGKIIGEVRNEAGEPVKSYVRTTRSLLQETFRSSYGNAQRFELMSPTNLADTLFVIPKDLTYFADTILIPANRDSITTLNVVRVKERKHRMKFIVIDDKSKQPLKDAVVKLLDYEQTTNAQGEALFEFKNASLRNFDYKITPPYGSDYVPVANAITNAESKQIYAYTVKMNKGFTLTGKVLAGGAPVPKAEVWVQNGNGCIKKTRSDAQGNYTLKGIGFPYIDIYCDPPKDTTATPDYSNYIGQSAKVTFSSTSAQKNFELTEYNKANIAYLHGFPVRITKLTEKPDGNVEMSGTVNLEATASNFKMVEEGQTVMFNNITAKPDAAAKDAKGRPYLDVDNFKLNAAAVKVRLMGDANSEAQSGIVSPNKYNYFVRLEGSAANQFLQIATESIESGTLRSKARIVDNSFNFPGSYFRFEDDQFYLSEKTTTMMMGNATVSYSSIISSFKASINKLQSNAYVSYMRKSRNYTLTDKDGKALKFKFLNFNANSPVDSSYITPSGTIVLVPHAWTLNPLLPNSKDTVAIDLPAIGITADGVNVTGQKINDIKIKFEQWTIVANQCEVNPQVGGIYSTNAEIQTGVVNIPLKDFNLCSDLIYLGKPDKTPVLKLGGIADLIIASGVDFQFGLDPRVGKDLKPHYKVCFVGLEGKSAASASGLPGFAQKLEFQAVSLLSNGEQILSFAPNSQSLKFRNVAMFRPFTISSYQDNFSVDGAMDLGIPRVPDDLTYRLVYEKQGSALKVTPMPQLIEFDGPGYVRFTSNPQEPVSDRQIFEEGKLTLYGRVKEENKLDPINIVLTKKIVSSNKYDIDIKKDIDVGEQYIALGEKSDPDAMVYIIDSSRMVVKNNDWDLLRLKIHADPKSANDKGFGGEPLYIAVFGEIKLDTDFDNQKIKATGDSSSNAFGDFVITCDFPKKRIFGTMNIKEQKMGGTTFSGVAEMLIEPKGFYFAATGQGKIPVFGTFSVGFVFGHYNAGIAGGIPTSVQNMVTKYSVSKDFPCCFQDKTVFSGFFLTGRFPIPDLTYDVGIDLSPIAVAKVKTEATLEAGAWASFVGEDKQIGISAILYAKAELQMKAIICTDLYARAEGMLKGQAIMGLNGVGHLSACASIDIFGKLKQGIPIPLSGCQPLIEIGSKDKPFISFKAELDASINLYKMSNPSFSAKFSTGSNCAANACSANFISPSKPE